MSELYKAEWDRLYQSYIDQGGSEAGAEAYAHTYADYHVRERLAEMADELRQREEDARS